MQKAKTDKGSSDIAVRYLSQAGHLRGWKIDEFHIDLVPKVESNSELDARKSFVPYGI